MQVKMITSAAGADFALSFGQEIEFDELKRLVGNGSENFCTPLDTSVVWPPVAEEPIADLFVEPEADELVEAAVEPEAKVEPEAESVADSPAIELAVVDEPIERAVKSRGRAR